MSEVRRSKHQSRTNLILSMSVLALIGVAIFPRPVIMSREMASTTTEEDKGSLQVRVEKKKDGSAKVIFQPAGDNEISIFNSGTGGIEAGTPLGTVGWKALFEIDVPAEKLKAATTSTGIDIKTLVDGVVGVVEKDGSKFVMTRIPFPVASDDKAVDLKANDVVLLKLHSLALEGKVTPVGAQGRANVKDETKIADDFNKTIVTKGVVGVKPAPPEKKKPVVEVPRNQPRVARDAHGDPVTPLGPESQASSDLTTAIGARFLSSPTCSPHGAGYIQKSYYGKRVDPFGQGIKHHDGLDIAGAGITGTPIVAAADGCVSRQLFVPPGSKKGKGGWGNTTYLEHKQGDNTFTTQYSHMEKHEPAHPMPQCASGKGYKRGDTLGYVGMTGRCTGPHLHFGLYKNGISQDPRRYMMETSNASLSMTCSALKTKTAAIRESEKAHAQARSGEQVAHAGQGSSANPNAQ